MQHVWIANEDLSCCLCRSEKHSPIKKSIKFNFFFICNDSCFLKMVRNISNKKNHFKSGKIVFSQNCLASFKTFFNFHRIELQFQ